MGDLGLNPKLGRSPGGGCGNSLQYSSLENPHGQRSLVNYSPWGTQRATKHTHCFKVMRLVEVSAWGIAGVPNLAGI